MSVPETDITLYTYGTPNGHKISIALEELGIKYKVRKVDLFTKNEQKEDWYLRINRMNGPCNVTESSSP